MTMMPTLPTSYFVPVYHRFERPGRWCGFAGGATCVLVCWRRPLLFGRAGEDAPAAAARKGLSAAVVSVGRGAPAPSPVAALSRAERCTVAPRSCCGSRPTPWRRRSATATTCEWIRTSPWWTAASRACGTRELNEDLDKDGLIAAASWACATGETGGR